MTLKISLEFLVLFLTRYSDNPTISSAKFTTEHSVTVDNASIEKAFHDNTTRPILGK